MPAQLTLKVQSHTLLGLINYDGNITMFTKVKIPFDSLQDRKYTLYEQCVGSFTSGHRIYYKACKTGCEVYHPYPKRVESLTICRCYYVGSVFSSVMRPF